MANEQIQAVIDALSEPDPSEHEPVVVAGEGNATTESSATDDKGITTKNNVVDSAKTAAEGTEEGAAPTTDAVLDAEKNGNVADPDPNALPEDVEALPRVQELIKSEQIANNFLDLLAEGYAIDTEDPQKALEQLRLERSDAHLLYSIVDGRADAGAFLDMLADPQKYSHDIAERVFTQLSNSMAKLGFLQSYIAASGYRLVPIAQTSADGTVDPAATPNPLEQRVNQLASTLEQQQQAQRNADAQRDSERVAADKQVVFETFVKECNRLAEAKGVDKEFWPEYANQIAAGIKGNPAILKRIREGKFVDVQRLFTLHHNGQIQRFQKWSTAASAGKTARNAQVPKTPAGGSTPAPSGAPTKRNVSTYESRVAAVVDAL